MAHEGMPAGHPLIARGSVHRLAGLLPALAALLVLGAAARPVGAQSFEVVIGATLQPSTVTVPVGATVTWRNEDGQRHRMRSRSGPEKFDSGNIEAGETFTHVFNVEGTYAYLDERNPGAPEYAGQVIVSSGASGAPAASGASGAAGPAASSATVNMAGRRFAPATVTIAVGGTVTFNNNDGDEHTATARDRSFNSGTLNGGARFEHTFSTVGRFAYICAFHSDMTGEVVVTDASGATPPPAPPAAAPSTAAGAPSSAATTTSGGPVVSSIVDFDFTPKTLTVRAGQSVTWTNDGTAPHTVTAHDRSFDSGMLNGGQTFTRTFATPGRFPFLCVVHPAMTGEVVVTDEVGGAPPASSAPASPSPAAPTSSAASLPSSSVASGGPAALAASILDFAYGPDAITVVRGSTVTWTNAGIAPHTVTAKDGSFDTGWINGGEAATLSFDATGAFPFYCSLHPNMVGTISVVEAASAVADANAAVVAGGATEGAPPGEPGQGSSAPGARAPASGTADDAPTARGAGGLSVALAISILLAVAAIGVAVGVMARRSRTATHEGSAESSP